MTRLADTTPADFTVGDVISFGDETQQYDVVAVDETGVRFTPRVRPQVPPYVAPPPNRRQRRAAAAQQRRASRRSS